MGVTLYTGSHNMTLMWATTVLLVVGLAALLVIPSLRPLITRRGLLRLAVVAVPAVLVNAWFLLPAIAYQSHTVIASNVDAAHKMLLDTIDGTTAQHLFNLGRKRVDPLLPRLAVQLPVLATASIVAGLLITRPKRSSPWLRAALLLLVVAVATWALMTQSSVINGLPHPYDMLQNPLRLEAYINLAICGALIATLVLTRRAGRRRRVWVWVIAGVVAFTVVQARQQVREPLTPWPTEVLWTAMPYNTSRDSPTRSGQPQHPTADYTDADVPLYIENRAFKSVRFPSAMAERTDRTEATINAQPGEVVSSNLKASPRLIHVDGARIVSRSDFGDSYLKIDADAKPGAARIVVTTAHPWPVMVGRLLTLLGLLSLAGVGVALLARAWRSRLSAG